MDNDFAMNIKLKSHSVFEPGPEDVYKNQKRDTNNPNSVIDKYSNDQGFTSSISNN